MSTEEVLVENASQGLFRMSNVIGEFLSRIHSSRLHVQCTWVPTFYLMALSCVR